MADPHLAGEGDGVGRIGLHPQSFERGVGPPGTRPGRKCETGRQADQNAEEDERPPTSTHICSRPECRRSYTTMPAMALTVRATPLREKVGISPTG